ncbi:hypothetical protein Trco_008084 [Trichoderma cornu-damae]|uniref:Uncharacterized protein n=1 Tax=Trichoderma cornu-damae TaxID=654480 RepID=A0A9P8TTQ5_9HYPO|nr:hypothetical protein Trco_008084 [Trichoderma cornu-damae]
MWDVVWTDPDKELMASSASSGVESPTLTSSDRSPVSKTFDEESCRGSGRVSTSFLERRANIESPPNTSPLIPEKACDATRKLPLDFASDDGTFSTLPTKHITTAGPTSDDLTESEKMKSLMQIFGRIPTMIEPAENQDKEKAEDGEREKAVAFDASAKGPTTPPLSSEKISPSSSPPPPSSLAAKPKLCSPAIPIPERHPLRGPADTSTEMSITPNNPEAWKPVDEWEPLPLLRGSPEPAFDQSADSKGGVGINKDFRLLRAEAVAMASTGAPDILSRLEALWKAVPKEDVAFLLGDGPEVEELQRWMLSTMIHMDQIPPLDGQNFPRRESPLTARMTISLYDSAAIVAYLAALEPTKQHYHVSQLPILKRDLFVNVRVISVSEVSPTDFPVAPRIYESVHSLTLPSLCPSSFLPGILNNVYKCLKKKGFISLVLIDPLPRAGTMGRKMKSWIEESLLRNLARQGKCMSPSTAFPPLLAGARLRGDGSTLTTTKFYAVPSSATNREPDAAKDILQTENEAKAQVRSLVGRMLWVQVWGPYVTSNKWWWDDPECVAECLELGTFWEYHTVKGIKEPKTTQAQATQATPASSRPMITSPM